MVGGPNLDPLKPRLFGAQGSGGVGVEQLFDFRLGHGMRAVAVMVGRLARGAPMRGEGQV